MSRIIQQQKTQSKPTRSAAGILGSTLPLKFTFCGRHGSGNRHLESKKYYSQCDDNTKLKKIVADTIKRESHINENVVAKNYLVFKGHFKDASLKSTMDTDRWSSHLHHDPDDNTKLKKIVADTSKRESHINENVVAKNYLVFKGHFKDASLKGRAENFP